MSELDVISYGFLIPDLGNQTNQTWLNLDCRFVHCSRVSFVITVTGSRRREAETRSNKGAISASGLIL